MGLCKCPKRNVTNLFCYVHHVNVCEHCLVYHPKCIVQSYIHWLQDSDYVPVCTLCDNQLEADECIRLVCYHVFHWRCLDLYGHRFPPTTAPAGYTCPSCNEPILPKPNVVSPVAQVLRDKLATVNWARVGLDLPLVDEEERPRPEEQPLLNHEKSTPQKAMQDKDDIVVHVEDPIYSRPDKSAQMPRRSHVYSSGKTPLLDVDESKYRRNYSGFRIPVWMKSLGKLINFIRPRPRKPWEMIFFAILVFVLICFVLSYFGRMASDDKPELDPHNNPHILTG